MGDRGERKRKKERERESHREGEVESRDWGDRKINYRRGNMSGRRRGRRQGWK